MVGSNYTRRAAGPRSDDARRDPQGVGLQPRRRRADQEGRLWYLRARCRDEGSQRTVPGMFANANAGDPTKWTYVADRSRPAVDGGVVSHDVAAPDGAGDAAQQVQRVLGRAEAVRGRRRAGVSGGACRTSGDDEIYRRSTPSPTPSATATLAPETAAYRDYGQRVQQAKWTSPADQPAAARSRLRHLSQPLGRQGRCPGHRAGANLIRVVEQCADRLRRPTAASRT